MAEVDDSISLRFQKFAAENVSSIQTSITNLEVDMFPTKPKNMRPILAALLCACGLLTSAGSLLAQPNNQPREVILTPPSPLPAIGDQVRSGHWIHGINWPWDHYGVDFGANAWGYRGLANQGPSGWRRETRAYAPAAKSLFWAQRGNDDYCMGVQIELTGPSSNALVYFYLDEPTNKKAGETLDLTGQTVTVDLYLPAGIEGPTSARTGAVLFVQDDDWTWAETTWMNIERTDQWITLSADLDDLASRHSGFSQSRIRAVGVKIGTNDGAGAFSYQGPFYIDNVKASSAPEIQFGFTNPDTRSERELKDAANLGINFLRWWIFADGRAALKFDDNGFVTGLSDEFNKDFDELIRLSRSTGLYLVPVLFDFLLGAEAVVVDGVQTFGRADLINDPAKRQSLLDNAVSVLFDKLAQTPEVVIIDLFNEPEWLLLDSDSVVPAGRRPPEIRAGGIISLATMKEFFSEIVALHRSKGLAGKQLLTIGSASPKWVTLWQDLDLDIAQLHLWNGPGQIDAGLAFDFQPPVSGISNFLGEFSTLPELQDTCEILDKARLLGYSGAFPWAYRAKDTASLPLLGLDARACIARLLVIQQYRDILEREAGPAEIDYWSDQLARSALSDTLLVGLFFSSVEFSVTVPPIIRLYLAAFGRVPDFGGVQYWSQVYRQGTPLESIAEAFAHSAEFQNRYGAVSHRDWVVQLYRRVLVREPGVAEVDWWAGLLDSGRMSRGQVLLAFSESAEYRQTSANGVFVIGVYMKLLRRAPEPGGLAYWIEYLAAGGSRLSMLEAVLNSVEYHSRFLPP